MFGLQTPDITLAQIVAAVTWVVGQAVAMGVVDGNTSQYILQIAVTAISAAWVIGDSIIRHGRAQAAAAAAAAKVIATG